MLALANMVAMTASTSTMLRQVCTLQNRQYQNHTRPGLQIAEKPAQRNHVKVPHLSSMTLRLSSICGMTGLRTLDALRQSLLYTSTS